MQKGSIIEIKLDDLAYGGDCVGHLDNGLAVFVSGGVPGDIIRGKVYKKKTNYIKAEILEIISPSPDRIKPECEVYDECGGCQLQQVDYAAQLKYKRKIVKESLERIGKFTSVKVNEVIGSDFPWYYRNKAQIPLTLDEDSNIKAGFYRQGTHEVIAAPECLIQHQMINRIKKETIHLLNQYELSVYNEKTHRGLLRHLLIRAGICTNQALLTFITKEESFPEIEEIAKKLLEDIPELKGVLQNINPADTNVILGDKTKLIKGKDKYTEYTGFIKFEISPESFFQINTLQTKELYDYIKKFSHLSGKETDLDAYCGIGSIALYLADKSKKVLGIEQNPAAVKDADHNAQINKINNCDFIEGKVEDKLPELLKKGINPEVVVVDPPRKGLNNEFINKILSFTPEKIVYISCNPSTLARDLKKIHKQYEVKEIQPLDMFPQTYHIETVVNLSRR
ncbi:MAG: 23S rRNA (uracil(1939)-C(5))-methyltransferase RlmD [Bacillota bacterium]